MLRVQDARYRDYRGYIRVILGIMEKKMGTAGIRGVI